VDASAKTGTLRVDFDRIAQTLGASTPHAAEPHIRGAAFAAREALIAHALKSPDEDTWIIHTSPTPAQVDQYEKAGAQFTLLDPGKDTCIQRAGTDDRPEHTASAIAAWYETPPALPAPAKADALRRRLTMLRIETMR
jgi:hypothetical protein